MEDVRFLVDREFISTTYNILEDGTLVLRVYLIPSDLPGGRGRFSMEVRKKFLVRAKKSAMPNILASIKQDFDLWDGVGSSFEGKYLVNTEVVRQFDLTLTYKALITFEY